MTETTGRLGLPLLQAAQAQKEVTHNEALQRLDQWSHPRIESRTALLPPAEPMGGQAWIVPAGAGGAWAGRDGQIAEWDGEWLYLTPASGLLAWVADENCLLIQGESGWISGLPAKALNVDGRIFLAGAPAAVADPAGGTTVDTEARAALTALLDNLRALGLVTN